MHSWNGNGKYGSRQKRKDLIPNYCELGCGWNHHITKHRIKPGSEGGKYVVGNVIGLCPNCHWLSDNDFIPKWVLFRIVYARLQLKYKLNGFSKATEQS